MAIILDSKLFNFSGTGTVYTGGITLNPNVILTPFNPYAPTAPTAPTAPVVSATDQEALKVIAALDSYPVVSVAIETRAIQLNNKMDTEAQRRALDALKEWPGVTAYDVRIIHVTAFEWLRTGRFTMEDLKKFLSFALLYKNTMAARGQVVYIKQGGTGPQYDPQVNPTGVPGINTPPPVPIPGPAPAPTAP